MDIREFENSCLLSTFAEEECLEFPQFQQHLMIMLNELQEKRAEMSKSLKEMSKMTLRYNEQERLLDCERRTLAGLQLQLDQATQIFRKKESEAELATQQVTKLDMQLTLANKEVAVLREECKKIELQLLDQTQHVFDLEEEVKNLNAFKNSCVGVEDKVKSFMLISEREMNLLKTEVNTLAESVQKTSMRGVLFETTVKHFECLKKQQIDEFEKAKTVIVQKQCKIQDLEAAAKKMAMSAPNKTNPLEITVAELTSKLSAIDQQLEHERSISTQLKEILSKSVQAQEKLHRMESEANEKLAEIEAKLVVSSSNEELLKQENESIRKELRRLEALSVKASVEEKETQTIDEHEAPSMTKQGSEAAPEKLSTSALCVQDIREQFLSAITASGDDWSKYLAAPRKE